MTSMFFFFENRLLWTFETKRGFQMIFISIENETSNTFLKSPAHQILTPKVYKQFPKHCIKINKKLSSIANLVHNNGEDIDTILRKPCPKIVFANWTMQLIEMLLPAAAYRLYLAFQMIFFVQTLPKFQPGRSWRAFISLIHLHMVWPNFAIWWNWGCSLLIYVNFCNFFKGASQWQTSKFKFIIL